MLHRGDDDLVARAYELASIAVHHQIDAFGRAAHEDTLARFTRIDEAFDLFTRALVSGRSFLAQVVNASVNVRVFLFEIDAAAINDDLRNLRRGRVIQIDERLTVDRLPQHREILADTFDIPRRFSL